MCCESGSEVLNHTRSLTLSSLHVYNVSSLQPGVWNVSVVNSRSRDFSAVVAASTPVSFTYRLAVLRRGPHGGYAPISGNPIAGAHARRALCKLTVKDNVRWLQLK